MLYLCALFAAFWLMEGLWTHTEHAPPAHGTRSRSRRWLHIALFGIMIASTAGALYGA